MQSIANVREKLNPEENAKKIKRQFLEVVY